MLEDSKEASRYGTEGEVQEIFYNPSKNTCMYKYVSKNQRMVVDFFTKEIVLSTLLPDVGDNDSIELKKMWLDDQMRFDKEYKELKGE